MGIVLLLALLLFNGLFSYRAVRVLRQRRIAVREIYDSRQNLEQLFSLLKDAESGQRGYIYTGESSYLAPYTEAVPKIEMSLNRLGLDHHPQALPDEVRLKELIQQKLNELAETVALRRQGRAAEVRELVISGRGKETMDAIRNVISTIEARQQVEVDEAVARQMEADSYLVATLVVATSTAFLFVLLFAAALNRETRRSHQLQAAERLATTGRMAATVAHEINNPLEAATNLIYLAQTDPAVPDRVKEMLDLADRELARVAHMTKQTLGFYRSSTPSERFDVTELLDEIVLLFDSKLRGKSLVVQKDLARALTLEGNRGEIFQVITNIVSNAIDASYNGGTIRLGAAEENAGISVTVEDEGIGIPKEVQDKIFQAFMTTKKDVGTGLGLWVCERLVAKNGGRITVNSLSDGRRKGSLFRVWLPYAISAEAGQSAASSGF